MSFQQPHLGTLLLELAIERLVLTGEVHFIHLVCTNGFQ